MNKDLQTNKYDHLKIEKKWQSCWNKNKVNKTTEAGKKPKCYVLDMFPYPSGDGLHVGHPRGYIATDVYSRFKKMQGFNVLHPMGWDAFGLPAENYAIKNKISPEVAMKKNIKRFKNQLQMIGLNYDWDREVSTIDPKYFKWTQWIFLQLLKKGLAYESYAPINWCPSCKTGLANEDLDGDKCERCGTIIEKKPMKQWVLKIRDYADRLLKDLDELDWPEHIKELQRNWIGRSEGAEITFKLKELDQKITVFTTRPDTLFGLSYIVLAPENSLVDELKSQISNWKDVENYRKEIKGKSEIDRTAEGKEKTGVELKGIKAINPVDSREVPVFISDYVLANYGTGAVMAVPAHDDRDYAFAKKYNLPITEVIIPERIDRRNPPVCDKKTVERRNVHVIVKNPKTGLYLGLKWKNFNWTTFPMGGIEDGESVIEAAKRELFEETGYKNVKNGVVLGGQVKAGYFAAHKDQNRTSYTNAVYFELVDEKHEKINDEESKNHEVIWLTEKDIHSDLMTHAEIDIWLERLCKESGPYTDSGVMINSGQFNGRKNEDIIREITEFAGGKMTNTYKLQDWVFSRQRYWGEPIPVVHCEKCALSNPAGRGVVAVPEKDLPLKLPKVKFYEPSGTGESPLAKMDKWVNTKCPKCKGKAKRETNTMPQWAGSSWYYLRYMDPKNSKVLVDKKTEKYWAPVDMYVGGAEHATRHLIYARFWHKFLFDIGVVSTREPFKKLHNQGMILGSDNRKMSKRWGNVVNPDDVVKNVGADTLRVYESFMGPFEQEIAWNTDSMVGSRRFLEKVWKLQNKVSSKFIDDEDTIILLNKTIKKVGEDIESFNANTAISSMMILANALEEREKISKDTYLKFIKILSPFAPHFCEEIWSVFGGKKMIVVETWPKYEESKLRSSKAKIVVQVNGKVRATIEVENDAIQSIVEKKISNNVDIQKWLEGKDIKKIIFIKNKIINFVV
ncbi:MAG: leucine--tRNA ligase [Candidatus Pacebacteria bacterium]|nr:leucine--tRNA ligase [Candidatus Paceibacterota bacterium]